MAWRSLNYTRWGLMRRCLTPGIMTIALSAAALAPAADGAVRTQLSRCASSRCTCAWDELVLRLADRKNIASITWLSQSPSSSNVSDLAALMPVNHGLAEEIIPLKPDLVLAGHPHPRTAVALLKRSAVPLMELDVPNSIEGVRKQYLEMAEVLGERDKGERIVADIDDRLAKLAATPAGWRPRAIVLNPNGVTVGPGIRSPTRSSPGLDLRTLPPVSESTTMVRFRWKPS